MSTHDDEAWLEALAGRTTEADRGGDALEGGALRALIQLEAAAVTERAAPADAARESALIELARAERLLPPLRHPSRPTGASQPAAWWAARRRSGSRLAIAAAVAAVAVGVFRWTAPPREIMRGADHGIVRLESPDPASTGREISREFSEAGVHVSIYERLGRVGIDADLPQPVPAAVASVLQRHHIPPPADGALVVEITAPRPP